MLVILTLFSMVAIAVYNKGIVKPQGERDPEWQKRGGDSSMTSATQMSFKGESVGLDQPGQPDLRKEVGPAVPADDGTRKLVK